MLNEKTTIETEVIKAQNPEDLISQVIELQKKGFELFGGRQYNFYMVVMFRESTQQTPDSVWNIIFHCIKNLPLNFWIYDRSEFFTATI